MGSQISGLFSWLGQEINAFFSGIVKFFETLLQPIIFISQGFYYLLQQVFNIVILVVQVIFGLFQVLLCIILGVFNTFSQLSSYSGSTQYYNLPSNYLIWFRSVTGFFNTTGMNQVAAILCVFIWIATAIVIIKMAGSGR